MTGFFPMNDGLGGVLYVSSLDLLVKKNIKKGSNPSQTRQTRHCGGRHA